MTVAVRLGGLDDVEAIGRLLHAFNREFEEPTPPPSVLAERFRELCQEGNTVVLLAGEGPDGLAVLRFRAAIWSAGLECYLAELYVVPDQRGADSMERHRSGGASGPARPASPEHLYQVLTVEEAQVVKVHVYTQRPHIGALEPT